MNSSGRNAAVSRFRRKALTGAVVAVLLLALPGVKSTQAAAPERVVAVGDVHGELDAFVGILQEAGLINSQQRWVGGQATLVQTGDILDRGPKSRPVMDLLMALEKQARRKGGRVVVLLGNHEVMNLTGDLRYVSAEEYASYADGKSEKRRKAAYRAYLDYLKDRTPSAQSPQSEKEWMDNHPLGFLEHCEAFAPTGKYGRWLREHAAVAKLDGVVFLHGGLSPTLASWSLEAINARIREEINAFDTAKQYLVEQKLALPFFSLGEMAAAAQAELQARQEEQERRAAAEPPGKVKEPPEEERHSKLLQEFLRHGSWLIFDPEGPLWFRGFAQWSEEEGSAQLTRLLESLGASALVVGHTPQAGGRIHVSFGGRVFLIDTGMLSGTYAGGRASALEMQAGVFTAIYPGQRAVLLNRSRTASPAGDGDPPKASEAEVLADSSASQTQEVAPAPAIGAWIGPDGKPLPFTSDEEIIEFLRAARMKRIREIGEGITRPKKVLLEKDGVQVNAVFRDVNEAKAVMSFASGRTEMQFRDSFLFEPAAFELSRLLGLDNVPPTTLRRLEGKKGSIQIWVENAMTETARRQKKISPPDVERYNNQMYVFHVFDALVHNTDRNLGNVLIDPNWKLWMIDHTRAFRRSPKLENPERLNHCEANLFDKLRTLDEGTVRQRLKEFLASSEIDALLKRRRQLVEHFEKLIQERGEDKVLYRLP